MCWLSVTVLFKNHQPKAQTARKMSYFFRVCGLSVSICICHYFSVNPTDGDNPAALNCFLKCKMWELGCLSGQRKWRWKGGDLNGWMSAQSSLWSKVMLNSISGWNSSRDIHFCTETNFLLQSEVLKTNWAAQQCGGSGCIFINFSSFFSCLFLFFLN